MKTTLTYAIRTATAPGEERSTQVPVIVNRKAPVSLTKVVENAIDRGLIVGPKTSAAEEIARGIADQMYKEFQSGNGVAFGQYFYGRLYLDGTTGANGELTKANKVNVRLYKGEDFRLGLGDFSFTYEGSADEPTLNFLLSKGEGVNLPRNELVEGMAVTAQGTHLKLDGDTVKVTFKEVGGSASVDVTAFTAAGPDGISFAWPASLVAGKSYEVTVYRTGEDGLERISNSKRVTVRAGETPAGTFTFTGVNTSGGPMGLVNYSQSIQMHGTGLVEEAAIEAKPTDSAGEFFAVPGGFMDFDSDELIRLDSEVQVGDMTLWDYLTQTVGISSQHNSVTFRITQDGESKTATATVNFE